MATRLESAENAITTFAARRENQRRHWQACLRATRGGVRLVRFHLSRFPNLADLSRADYRCNI
jgi:hypothetical protein